MILEITESAYTKNSDQVIQVVEHLRKRGFRIAMDDFGTGYSSLNVLSTMPIDVIKMDIDFVKNIEVNERDKQLVALILEIANKINVPVIAEGVETQAQLSLLHDLGCPMVQGFYFSRPLPPFEFEKVFLK
jgi:EAL domain-containing protein (putative c-di-GMP-specific phosphodiesterase class I)